VRTAKNVLISVNPKIRLPRTFRRFAGLTVQLLQKLSIRATNGAEKLLRVVKGPVTKYFPAGAQRVGFSHSSPTLTALPALVAALPEGAPIVFVVGAFAHGAIEAPYVDTTVSVSQYPLSAAYCLGRITNALEAKWSIV
jgi:rRNA small subunit pseudouridine methyltransferase Nep1